MAITTSRIIWVDYYKTISIFLIVIGHTFMKNMSIPCFLYIFHVPLFFFVSGYLDKSENYSCFQYTKKIFLSLIVPYVIWNVISIVFHFPISCSDVLKVVVGLERWNGASWFLVVLFFVKLTAMFFKKRYYVFSVLLLSFIFMLFMRQRVPFSLHLSFLYFPFYFVGVFFSKPIDRFVNTDRKCWHIVVSIFAMFALLFMYHYSSIPHVYNVEGFRSQPILYWITGFLGIVSVLFVSLCFNSLSKNTITNISSATLFIMCSHYEVLKVVTTYTSYNYCDFLSLLISVIYFAVQCLCIPFVLKYLPLLAGRNSLEV